ncbi:hypothetical protein DFJ73DRAFT_861838 [Zopfochytrium polystomum]|nr:hypothetical protein DFJ73DRAFT_861838 [Zopfochytrium polystomum]
MMMMMMSRKTTSTPPFAARRHRRRRRRRTPLLTLVVLVVLLLLLVSACTNSVSAQRTTASSASAVSSSSKKTTTTTTASSPSPSASSPPPSPSASLPSSSGGQTSPSSSSQANLPSVSSSADASASSSQDTSATQSSSSSSPSSTSQAAGNGSSNTTIYIGVGVAVAVLLIVGAVVGYIVSKRIKQSKKPAHTTSTIALTGSASSNYPSRPASAAAATAAAALDRPPSKPPTALDRPASRPGVETLPATTAVNSYSGRTAPYDILKPSISPAPAGSPVPPSAPYSANTVTPHLPSQAPLQPYLVASPTAYAGAAMVDYNQGAFYHQGSAVAGYGIYPPYSVASPSPGPSPAFYPAFYSGQNSYSDPTVAYSGSTTQHPSQFETEAHAAAAAAAAPYAQDSKLYSEQYQIHFQFNLIRLQGGDPAPLPIAPPIPEPRTASGNVSSALGAPDAGDSRNGKDAPETSAANPADPGPSSSGTNAQVSTTLLDAVLARATIKTNASGPEEPSHKSFETMTLQSAVGDALSTIGRSVATTSQDEAPPPPPPVAKDHQEDSQLMADDEPVFGEPTTMVRGEQTY